MRSIYSLNKAFFDLSLLDDREVLKRHFARERQATSYQKIKHDQLNVKVLCLTFTEKLRNSQEEKN